MKVKEDERNRRADSVLRCITENPGLPAGDIGRRLGNVSAREVRERIRRLRARGHAIVIGETGHGYYLLDSIDDPKRKADVVRLHRNRTRAYLIDSATLAKQLGQMTAEAIGEQMLFDLTVPLEDAEKLAAEAPGPDQLAQLPAERRAGYFKVLSRMLDRIANDPVAFAAERAYLADKFGSIFLTRAEAQKLAQARKLLEEIGTNMN